MGRLATGTASAPDNSPKCANWPVKMACDPTTHRSFDDFFANSSGVRTKFLQMVGQVAASFATVPGVIGYDLLNEPWGDEKHELAPLYEDMARMIRARHPAAILFVEGHVTTNCGMKTKLPRPSYGGFAYAPHYYKPLAIVLHGWRSSCWALIGRSPHGPPGRELGLSAVPGRFGMPHREERRRM